MPDTLTVVVRDHFNECDTVYMNVVRLEDEPAYFKLFMNGGFSKEFRKPYYSCNIKR